MMNKYYGIFIPMLMAILLIACDPVGAVQNPQRATPTANPAQTSTEPTVESTPVQSPTSDVKTENVGLLLVEWQRSGGIAGGCRKLLIYQDDRFQVLDCQERATLGEGQLPQEEIDYLSDLATRYGAFRWEFNPPKNTADMFTDWYNFSGNGKDTPTDETMQEINNHLALLTSRLLRSFDK